MSCCVKVISGSCEKVISAEKGEALLDVLVRAGVKVSAPCGGNGKCGKCLVKATGAVKTDENGYCLACKTCVEGDCEITTDERESSILTGGEVIISSDEEEGLGLAVDIGTTTVAGYIVDLSTGRTVRTLSALNPQRSHGADVISRLQYGLRSQDNAALLKKETDEMLISFAKDEQIKKAVLVGNTVMMHLAGGYDGSGLAKAPFTPCYLESHTKSNAGIETLFGGVISGYVGADTVAAVLACDMDNKDETALMIDIGTNGEIVLKHRGKMLCCSCAAGPAFEGAHIKCGIGAVKGAIDHVMAEKDGSCTITTIGSEKTCGICGSGLVDAVDYLLESELISAVGRMQGDFYLSDGVYISPEDIREVQLAKAAICAGIKILMDRLCVDTKDVEKVYLAGGFGNYIDAGKACEIGLFPSELREKITPVGNAAGTGARMLLISENARKRYERIRQQTEYIELSEQEDFEDMFADCLLFDDID